VDKSLTESKAKENFSEKKDTVMSDREEDEEEEDGESF